MKVYRLRNLPARADRLLAAELLAACTIDVAPHQIRISSLAHVMDPWTRPPTKTATLTIESFNPDTHAQFSSGPNEWTLRTPGLAEPLVLDHHFHGLTPLNDVDADAHEYDCIAISGLASHPFGSWQPHGGDKSFMWIRDKLPHLLPKVRFATYGYETRLYPSTSFQSVPDLAISLVAVLRSCGWSSPSAKPLIFLAHSLGGAVIKQALVMLAGSGQTETFISSLVRGIVFFGVPSRGMPHNDILTILGGQPNKDAFVAQISDTSDYLRTLEHQFGGIAFLRTVKLFWAYETKTTRTVEVSSKWPHYVMLLFSN